MSSDEASESESEALFVRDTTCGGRAALMRRRHKKRQQSGCGEQRQRHATRPFFEVPKQNKKLCQWTTFYDLFCSTFCSPS